MNYILHKSWVDYTFSNHVSFFTGTLEQVTAKQQEYTAIFQEVLKTLVCSQVISTMQFYTQLLEHSSRSKMKEDILTVLSIFNLTYREELDKLASTTLTNNEKLIQATADAYLACFYEGYELPQDFNQFLNVFLSIKENQPCNYIPKGIELPLNTDCSSLIKPCIALASLIPKFEKDYPYYWNEIPQLNKINHLENTESDVIQTLIREYRQTILTYMQLLEQQYGSDHDIFSHSFWETDAMFSICSQQEWDELDDLD